jgi:hypothetical protein
MKVLSRVEIDVEIGVDLIIERVRWYVRSQGWSLTRLAREAGLPHHTSLRNFDLPQWNPTANLLRKLEALVPADFHFDSSTDQ